MSGRHRAFKPVELTLLALVLSLVVGCVGRQNLREERLEIEAEVLAQEKQLAEISQEQALLVVARHQDARRGSGELRLMSRHPAAAVRAAALRALAHVGDPGDRGLLRDGLDDTDPQVQRAAAFALSLSWSWPLQSLEREVVDAELDEWLSEALEEAVERLPDEGPASLGPDLVRALGEVDGESGDEVLWRLASSGPFREDSMIALALRARRSGKRSLTDSEVEGLAPSDPGTFPSWQSMYFCARAGLEVEGPGPAVELLSRGADEGAPLLVRLWSLRAAGSLPGSLALGLLEPALDPSSPLALRVAAVRALGTVGEEALPLLVSSLEDPIAEVRSEAASGLGKVESSEGLEALLAWTPVAEEDRVARLHALASREAPVAEAEGIALVNLARDGLDDPEAAVRGASLALAAQSLSGEELLPLVEHTDTEEDRGARIEGLLALSQRDDPVLEGALLRWMEGKDPVAGAIAVEALGGREGEHLTTRMLAAWSAFPEPSNWERRLELVRALVPRAGLSREILEEMLSDPEPLVRRATYRLMLERSGPAIGAQAPELWALPDLEDRWFGSSDVRGATVETSRGELKVVLFADLAPSAVANFARLASDGSYEDILFHRVVPNFVVQGGDPEGTGWGGPGWTIRDEYSSIPYVKGTLGMARAGADTAGSQWFLTLLPHPHLERHYTAFGQLVSGWEVLDSLRQGDRILSVQLDRRSR